MKTLDERWPQLEDHQVAVGLMELSALIGDGHTFVFDGPGAI